MTEAPAITIVAALAKNRVIGINGALPWRIPEDLRHFKKTTMGGALVMGRRTFDSIGKPLPGRRTFVVTRRQKKIQGAETAASPQDAIEAARQTGMPVFIVGGEQIYRQTLPLATAMSLTELQITPQGDSFFPLFNPKEWQEETRTPMQETKGDFVHYLRR